MSDYITSTNEVKPGDGVSWSAGTDTHAGTVSRVTASAIFVVQDNTKLLNGSGSGESDALKFSPGGFVGHTSGRQRYEYSPGSGPEIRFSRRAAFWSTGSDAFKLAGTSSKGSMRSWGLLYAGRNEHYDYNF